MRKSVVLFFVIFITTFSTTSFAETTIGEQFKVFQDAILQRDEIIKTLIKRIELIEGEVKTIKNKEKIKQIVKESLKRYIQMWAVDWCYSFDAQISLAASLTLPSPCP